MTLPRERFRAIAKTRVFLAALRDPKRVPGIPSEVRHEAGRLLRHFPTDFDLQEAVQGLTLAAQVFALCEPIPKRKFRPRPDDDGPTK
jgi:hypothetical protein